jgi:hypothetical protein
VAATVANLNIRLKSSDQQTKVRITIQAEGSNAVIETRTYTFDPHDARQIEETIYLPDRRTYTCTVYDGDTQTEQKTLVAE